MEMIPYILFFAGCVLIFKGGDIFVDAATWMARVTGMSEVLIGATIVSLATTLPELMVSAVSSHQGRDTMAIGNAIGSTICNIGFILALYNIIRPSKIASRIFGLKGLIMIGYTIILWALASKGSIGLWEAGILLFLLLVYVGIDYGIVQYKKKQKTRNIYTRATVNEWAKNIVAFAAGLILILIGARLLVRYGVEISRYWGVPEAFISLTFIALGTSLPELVTSITALAKGHADLSIGNILGANILNLTMVLGVSAMIHPLDVSMQTIVFDIPISLIMGLMLVIPGAISKSISRWQGALLLTGYLLYIWFLFFVIG